MVTKRAVRVPKYEIFEAKPKNPRFLNLFGQLVAKEFIKALCNPAFKKAIDKTNDELAFLTRDNFLNNLIKENAVYIEIDMNNNLLVIQGNPLNLTIVESLIDEKLRSCKAVLVDDSVIFISDDPYEELDMPKSRSLGNTPIKMSSGKTDEINKSLEKLNVSPARPSAAVSLTNNLLLNIGLNQGKDSKYICIGVVQYSSIPIV